jgi:hypothetical protein
MFEDKFWIVIGAIALIIVVGVIGYTNRSTSVENEATKAALKQLKGELFEPGKQGTQQLPPAQSLSPHKEPMDWKDLVYYLGIMVVIIVTIIFLANPILQSFLDRRKT